MFSADKTYGFGVHSDAEEKIALVPLESDEYQNFLNAEKVEKVKRYAGRKLKLIFSIMQKH